MISQMEHPKCACGCGGFVSMFRGKWRKYLPWHHTRTPEWSKFHSKRMLGNKLFKEHIQTNKARKAISKSQTGSCNSVWNGGRTISHGGYVTILCKDHPYADVNGRVKEERLIMEKILGRYLLPNEVVHHVNKIKTDNRIRNLRLMSHYDHSVLHIMENRIWEGHRKNVEKHQNP